ncbi:alpha-tectorin-like [Salminus brasiliensis]|uniref:alpha-tectorin-like n=1 Tax=Salminus brasiliensis TaxID=930266 RepID=UPI003B82E537
MVLGGYLDETLRVNTRFQPPYFFPTKKKLALVGKVDEVPALVITTFTEADTTTTAETTTEVVFNVSGYDPCDNYTSLDQPWRSNSAAGSGFCDHYSDWNGWYRLLYNGIDVRMPESCVPASSCGTYLALWLNGPHPQIEDGVVTRQICGSAENDCCNYNFTSIRLKACPGNYYVYEFVKPAYCPSAYCTDTSTLNLTTASTLLTSTESVDSKTTSPANSTFDPCYNYTVLDDIWRKVYSYHGYSYYPYGYSSYYSSHDDTTTEWDGWYRLYLQGENAQIPEWCVYYMTSGGYTPLLLDGSHPHINDGIVTRDIYGPYNYGYYSEQCYYYRSNPIQVKACPGNYYVYKLVKPEVSIPAPTYTAVATNSPSYDPCSNYVSLDQPWRANNKSGLAICDRDFNWNSWYRLFYYGMNIRMPESCVDVNRCGTYYTLWLNGPHPQIEDGVVIRQVCGSAGFDCCYYKSPPIRVKACPGNYYVYEIVSPMTCNMAYCSDSSTITPTPAPPTAQPDLTPVTTPNSATFDPCNNYNVLNDYWRTIKDNYRGHDDTVIEWNGWYRLFLQGASAQIPEWCVSYMPCGGYTPLALGGSHPQIQDGIVTRDVYGSSGSQCTAYRSKPIQVKACPGNYYVYKLVKPDVSIPMPSYCAVTVNQPSFDPCNTYTSLDQPWRANNVTGLNICDHYFNWNGWYRLFNHGMNTRMPESCVPTSRCGSYYTLWLNGPHPQIGDGVVTRQLCGNAGNDCYFFRTTTIQVKACPGNYYVYELLQPDYCNMAYCTANSTAVNSFDPCENYTALNDQWRTARSYYGDNSHDDTLVEWNGWYRLYLEGNSAQLPEWCGSSMSCGGYTPLLLNGSHPRLQDGIVTREVYGSSGSQCRFYTSNSVQVKACPGQYYVYKLVRPDVSIPMPTYCAVSFSSTSYDPCTKYTSLDQPWRANNATGLDIYDSNFIWNGWYRLFYYGMNIRMADSCVPTYRCGGYNTLWLNGPHPQIEDGVVARQVCGNSGSDCCYFSYHAIQVKACPGNYYVYKFTNPNYHYIYRNYNPITYCTDVSTVTQISTPTTAGIESNMTMTISSNDYNFDPCYNHTVLNEDWRNMYNSYTGYDDTITEWNGWYRLYLQGRSAQMLEWCVSYRTCGGYTNLVLGGSHPREQDGIVTRSVYAYSDRQCNSVSRSNPIQVKACPGHYYVYKLVKPDVSVPMPTYCAVAFINPSTDPCNNYNALDQPWRSTNNAVRHTQCDGSINWNGWYRLLYQGNSTRMPESCVNQGMCGTTVPLWLNGSHPRLEDGVVNRKHYPTRNTTDYYSKIDCGHHSHYNEINCGHHSHYSEFNRGHHSHYSEINCGRHSHYSEINCGHHSHYSEFNCGHHSHHSEINRGHHSHYSEFNCGHHSHHSEINRGHHSHYSNFYQFGVGVGDIENERSDDGGSPAISLTRPFTFFGKTYSQVYVNNNGDLTFDQGWYSFTPYQFPASGGRDIVAAFWTDIDNRGNGVISYQQYTSGSVLSQATQDINQYFPQLRFNATWVFVATWDRVAYFPYSGTETSFQVVLISDEHLCFLLINYGEIAPTSRSVQAGYDTDDSSYYFSIPGSFQYNYNVFTYSSNVNVTGRWAFRVDHGLQRCEFNGNNVPQGTTFWTDSSCWQRCTCTRRGLQCSLQPCTFSQACRPAAFQYSCQNIQRKTCTISGDPHYYTFDNQIFHFQGTCTYVLSEACGDGLPYYRIEGKNEHRGSTHVSWTRLVRVFVYDEELELVKDHQYEAKVNGSFAATPFSLRNGSIQVYQSGFSVAISTDFGLVVTYDAYSYVTISVPYDYQNATCGLCGNFNYHPDDDFRTPLGDVLSSDVDFANSWKASGDTDPGCQNTHCSGLRCAACTTVQRNLYSNSDYCGILADSAGPFTSCHSSLAPQTFIENCIYDLCVGGGYQPILCQALNVYAAQCQQQGIQLGQWRRQGFCEISCPRHSHFESNGTSCPATCSNPSSPLNCPLPNQQSCICDAGYVLSAGECVPQANCGCTFEGLYYASGQSVVLDENCGRQCSCLNGGMSCQTFQCGPQEMCAIHNGVRGCRPIGYSTCWVEGPGSYHTFDGLMFSYPGACELTLARVMGLSSRPNFAVTVQKQPRGPQNFSRVLTFQAEGTHVSIKMGEGGTATVDGQVVALPFSVGSGRIHIYHSSVKGIIMETTFGVTVRADWPHLIRITAPSTYNGTLGGLCGNLNGYREDEFLSPIGVLMNDSRMFGDSWRDGSLSAFCEESTDIWQRGYYRNSSQFRQQCSIMASPFGPFAQCHSSLDPLIRVEDCISSLQQTDGAKEALCEALRGYAVLCQQTGSVVQEWRNITDCEFPCPANSHYQLCGTSCPAACPSLSFPFLCSQNCQEGCQCNDGLLLSGDRCVPPMGCGCLHEGHYRQGGERFWHGEQCQSQCVCDGTTGFVRCSPSSCSEQETCRIVGGEYGCHSQPHATCSASGDPHYTSFDGRTFDFQGTCRYILATVCNNTRGLPYFQVVARNEAWNGLPVSITVEVYVNVSGHLVHVSRNMRGTAEIDSETKNLPVLLDSGRVSVYSSGQNTFITTDFGLSVSYDGSWVVRITVPANYSGATCGLCGNFNGQKNDDFRIRSGALVPSAFQFGADWKVENDTSCSDGCGDSCSTCQNPVAAQAQCEILRDRQGPVSFCHSHVDPQAYFDDCAFDLCLFGNRHDVLCRSIQTYVSACQSANAPIFPWRQNTTCRMDCPVNSHYELCGTDCGHTCASSIDAVCKHTCSEGCFCNEGFVRSGGVCVPVEQCGCLYNGFYFNIGEKFWTPECSQRCECFAPNDLRCTASSCSPSQECTIRNGQRGCYSTMPSCMVWGDPHYLTFDGAVATFQGTCSYEISKTCRNVSDSGLEFVVVATNMHRENKAVSFASTVDIWLTKWGQQKQITIGQNKRVKVDGTDVDSSAFGIGQLAEVYREQDFVVVNASSELMVYFDGHFTLLVRLGPSFHGSVCGMCGNNNGDPADDKAMPNGVLAPSDDILGNSWKSAMSTPGCGTNDQRVDVNDCPFRQEYSEVCSIITNTSGPFQLCHVHVNPVVYFNSCVYDLCVYSSANGMLCSALEAYEVACTTMGLQISDWRSDLGCSRVDPCAELNCTADEWCGEKDNIYGCFCNENHPRLRIESYDSKEQCESSSGTMSLSRCQLFEAGFSADVLHLSDPNCTGTLQNGRLVFRFDNDDHICGTNLMANGTHFIYENTIQGAADSAGGPIHRKKYLELRFSCIYQISQTLTMDTELNPLQSIVRKTLPGQGMYQVRIIPYQDAGLSHPYNGSVSIVVDQRIYVGVFVQGVDSRQIATVIDSCWATPENDQHHAVHWDLIVNRCPNPADKTVEVLQNGASTTGHFSFKMFAFNGDYRKVFLHCSIHLCLLRGNNCAARCFPGYHRRIGRSMDIHDMASISVGPFVWTA